MRRRLRRSGRPWPTLLLAALPAAVWACGDDPVAPAPDGTLELAASWTTVEPATVGMDGAALDGARAHAGTVDRLRSLLVVRRGRLVLEEYWGGVHAGTAVDVRSVTKSVVSILVGIALERGELASVDQSIATVLEPAGYTLTEAQRDITVGHLLSMTGGFDWEPETPPVYNAWVLSDDPVEYLLDRDVVDPPGSHFVYNTAAVHLLGVLLEEATGSSLPDYADDRLFEPLGIQAREWEEFGDGHVNGGSGIDLRPRDLARLGQLMLQDGWSGERSIVPAPWVRATTRRRFGWTVQAGPLDSVSYGYLWWLDTRRDAWIAWGFGGQFIVVVPDEEMVVVATTEWRRSGDVGGPGAIESAVLDLIVNHVLPAAR